MRGDTSGGVWRRVDGVLSRETLGGVALLAPGSDEPVALDGTGALVWAELREAVSFDQLAASVAGTLGVAAPAASETIRPFLADLADRGFVCQAAAPC